MVVKLKETFEKSRNVKNNGKLKKNNLRGERNVRYYERILSKLGERLWKIIFKNYIRNFKKAPLVNYLIYYF